MTGKAHLILASVLATAAAAPPLAATPALAYRGHVYAHSFDGKTPGPGQFEKFEQPAGVAVNEATGDVYVVDAGKGRVERFNATGTAFEGSFNGGATPAKTLADPEGIAVDNTCHLHELKTGEALSVEACEKLDPSSGDVYVVDAGHGVIDKFSATGEYLNQLTGTCEKADESPPCAKSRFIPFKELDGVSVDAAGEPWVATSQDDVEGRAYNFNDLVVNEFLTERDTTAGLDATQRPGFAVDSHDDLYAGFENLLEGEDYVSEYGSEGSPLNTPLDSEPFEERVAGTPQPGIAVELTSDDVYIDDATAVQRLAPGGEAIERLGEGRLTGDGGVAVNSSGGQVYAVDSAAGEVSEFTLESAGAPEISGESVTRETPTGAHLQAEVDPHGASASYRFEYGRCASLAACASSGYEHSTSEEQAGSGFEVHSASLELTGLAVDSAYHFRVLASSEISGKSETVVGPEATFVTQRTGGEQTLPDGREWELVSPPDKHNALISASGPIQAATGGGAIAYSASGPIAEPTEAEAQGAANGMQVLSTRGSEGWSSHDLPVAHEGASGQAEGQGNEFRLFSQDLSLAAVQPFGAFTALSGEASEQTAYLRENASGAYTPLVSAANVPAGTVFGVCAAGQIVCGPKFRGATPDLSHVILSSPVALTVGAPSGEGLYEWAAGKLQYVGGVSEEAKLAFHAISSDGSRAIFSGGSEGHQGLLLRDTATGETAQLDAAASGCGVCAAGGGAFKAASSDGSTVFFTDEHSLAGGAGGTISSRGVAEEDLYVCETATVAGKLACGLSGPRDLTPLGAGGEQADVVGVLGASDNGSNVYFAANGILTGEADGAGEHAVQGKCASARALPRARCNLYALHRGGSGWEAPRLIAVLSGADQPDWSPILEKHTARSAPDGEWLTFMSQRSLTGYDNEDLSSRWPGERVDEEVYLYRAGAGVVCASCDPTGARPSGVEYGHIDERHGGLAGGEAVWPDSAWIAASVPGWESYEAGAAIYQPRYLLNDGRLFFDSSDELVAQAVNHNEDVYEYEPVGATNAEGAPACTDASATFGERPDGCVSLISAGTSAEESTFLDASESGGDVFFLTAEKLVRQDTDTSLDVYDAHECTAASPCQPAAAEQPPECRTATACKSPSGTQPTTETPTSATFDGSFQSPGNVASPKQEVLGEKASAPPKPLTRAQKLARALKVCAKERPRAKRKRCEASARKQYGPKAGKQANTKDGRGRP